MSVIVKCCVNYRQHRTFIIVTLLAAIFLAFNKYIFAEFNDIDEKIENTQHLNKKSGTATLNHHQDFSNVSDKYMSENLAKDSPWLQLNFNDIRSLLDDIMMIVPTWKRMAVSAVMMQYIIKFDSESGEAPFFGENDIVAKAPLGRLVEVVQQNGMEVIPSIQLRVKSSKSSSKQIRNSNQFRATLETIDRILRLHHGPNFIHLDTTEPNKWLLAKELFHKLSNQHPQLKFIIWQDLIKILSAKDRDLVHLYAVRCNDTRQTSKALTDYNEAFSITYATCALKAWRD